MDLTTKQITMDAREFIKEQGFGDINSKDRPINIEIANVAYLMESYASQQMPCEEEITKASLSYEGISDRYLEGMHYNSDWKEGAKWAVDYLKQSLKQPKEEQGEKGGKNV